MSVRDHGLSTGPAETTAPVLDPAGPAGQYEFTGAAAVAARVRRDRANGLRKSWIGITNLIDILGHSRLSVETAAAMGDALAEVGVRVEPPLTAETESSKVRLLQADEDLEPCAHSAAAYVKAAVWRTACAPVPVDLGDDWREPGAVLVITIDPDTEAAAAYQILVEHCPEVTMEAIEDLLEVDDVPAAATYGELHKVSTVAVFATGSHAPLERDAEVDTSKAGALTLQPLEVLAGHDYLIVCWHDGRRYEAGGDDAQRAQGVEDHLAAVAKCWVEQKTSDAGTLGLLLFRELARTYSRAWRSLYSSLELWELDFHRRGADTETDTLRNLRVLVAESQRRLNHLCEARYVVGELGWFPGTLETTLDRQLNSIIERAAEGLVGLSTMVRSAVDLVTTAGIGEQLRISQEQSRQGGRLQEMLALVTSVLLVPTFFAGLFGANTAVPGQGHWSGFVLMLCLMVAGGMGTYGILRRCQSR